MFLTKYFDRHLLMVVTQILRIFCKFVFKNRNFGDNLPTRDLNKPTIVDFVVYLQQVVA